MKKLKHIRILLSLVMLAECLALAILGLSAPMHATLAGHMQLTASKLTGATSATIGAWIIWLVATLILGRVYCASFCPVGVLQDIAVRMGELITRKHRVWHRRKSKPMRWGVLAAYSIAILLGTAVVPLLVEPWPAFVNIIEHAFGNADASTSLAIKAGVSTLWGMACAIVSVVMLIAYALATGRDFCNDICPIGSILSLAASRSAMHIELYPDRCTSCLKCEDVCKAGCIDITSRSIDNARCIRCFNCIDVCRDDALRYQLNPNGIITPMFRRTSRSEA